VGTAVGVAGEVGSSISSMRPAHQPDPACPVQHEQTRISPIVAGHRRTA
jgi:hypothetical protein